MGLSAVQSRLLTLTARSNELDGQIIQLCAREQLIASQTQELAAQYLKNLETSESDDTVNYKQQALQVLSTAIDSITTASSSNPSMTAEELLTTASETGSKAIQSLSKINNSYAAILNTALQDISSTDKTAVLTELQTQYATATEGITNYSSGSDSSESSLDFDNELFMAEYEAQVADLENQQSRIDTQKANAETQYQAVKSEKEAAETVIEKNIKSSFGTFSE